MLASSEDHVKLLLEQLHTKEVRGRQLTTQDYLAQTRQLYDYTPLPSLEPFLPTFFSFHGKPLTLEDYKQFTPLFMSDRPKRQTWKCSRQVGKSLSSAAEGLMLAGTLPGFCGLFVTPLGSQIQRLSITYFQRLLESMPMPALLRTHKSTIYRKDFWNNSTLEFSFASTSADRIRGIASDMVTFDEIQDFDPDHLAVIEASATASRYGYFQYMGTPKSLDNTIHGLWSESSQAEWCIKCQHCKELNIPALDYHLEDMIGPWHENISEETPGVVCHKCKKPLYPRTGRWWHRYPDRKASHAGYHISQVILPLHYADRVKWFELLTRQRGGGRTSYAAFCNETLGESIDVGQKLVTVTDLINAGSLGYYNNPNEPSPEVFERRGDYQRTILAIDWGGGGRQMTSFTTLAFLGMNWDGRIDCLWGKRLFSSLDHVAEAQECLHWMSVLQPDFLTHDYSGAGSLRETYLIQVGVPIERDLPISYTCAARRNVVVHVPATPEHSRDYWMVDKTRALLYVTQCIKQGLLRFFHYDGNLGCTAGASTETKLTQHLSLMDDFLALIEEKLTSQSGTDHYIINKSLLASDDFAHAVTYGCIMLWHMTNQWPNFANAPEPDARDIAESFNIYDDGIPGKL